MVDGIGMSPEDEASIERGAEIRLRTDLVELIGEYTTLRKRQASHHYVGVCPFHREATGSFHVDPAKGTYKCWGCGATGDCFTFIERQEKLTPEQAGEWLWARLEKAEPSPLAELLRGHQAGTLSDAERAALKTQLTAPKQVRRTGIFQMTHLLTAESIRYSQRDQSIPDYFRLELGRQMAEVLSDGREYVIRWSTIRATKEPKETPVSPDLVRFTQDALLTLLDPQQAEVGEYVHASVFSADFDTEHTLARPRRQSVRETLARELTVEHWKFKLRKVTGFGDAPVLVWERTV